MEGVKTVICGCFCIDKCENVSYFTPIVICGGFCIDYITPIASFLSVANHPANDLGPPAAAAAFGMGTWGKCQPPRLTLRRSTPPCP